MSKTYSVKVLRKLIISLWQYCKHTNNWEPEITIVPFCNTINNFALEPTLVNIFDYEILEDLLHFHLNEDRFKLLSTMTDFDADLLIDLIVKDMTANLADYFIIIPLNKASLTRSFSFGDFHFLTGSRELKIAKLAKLCNIRKIVMSRRAAHTEKSRSPEFFKQPLLAVRLHNTHGQVNSKARVYAHWLQCAILACYWAFVNPKIKSKKIKYGNAPYKNATHLAILSEEDVRCSHQSLNFNLACNIELDWMNNKKMKNIFHSIFDSIITKRDTDSLNYRFHRGLRYFGKAIEVEESRNAFEGLGLTITFLMIAAEGICFEQSQEIRSRLTVFLPELSELKKYSKTEKALAVENAYRWRSDYVHDGTDKYFYSDSIDQKQKEDHNINILKSMIAKIICDSPSHIKRLEGLRGKSNEKLERIWFEELAMFWKKKMNLI